MFEDDVDAPSPENPKYLGRLYLGPPSLDNAEKLMEMRLTKSVPEPLTDTTIIAFALLSIAESLDAINEKLVR